MESHINCMVEYIIFFLGNQSVPIKSASRKLRDILARRHCVGNASLPEIDVEAHDEHDCSTNSHVILLMHPPTLP